MLIPEGDWFCPPCQHVSLVNKLRDSLKTFDQITKKRENEILRKKRLAFVGISMDNVLPADGDDKSGDSSSDSGEDDGGSSRGSNRGKSK